VKHGNALEEVLLNGIVERFRPGVQTQQVATIADIALEARTLDAAMTKCSRWLPSHDQAAAARAAVPEPTELRVISKRLRIGSQLSAGGGRIEYGAPKSSQKYLKFQHQPMCVN
jgi:hypothetical protein